MGELVPIDLLSKRRSPGPDIAGVVHAPGIPRSSEVLIISAASTIITVGTINEMSMAQGREPSQTLARTLYKDINYKLDALNLIEQERAWHQASEVLDRPE